MSSSIRDLLAAIPRSPQSYAAMLLHAAGIEHVDLLRVLSHGTRDVRPVAPVGAWLSLRLHNDDFTTMDFVFVILHEVCRLDESSASAWVRKVHESESQIVATWRASEATERALEIFELASTSGFPLRVTLEAVE